MRLALYPLHPVACAAALLLALGLTAGARANDAPVDATKPAVVKPAIAKPAVAKPVVVPASGALTPPKAKTAAAEPGKADPAPAKAKPAERAEVMLPQGDEDLRKLLTERLAGTGEVVLKTGELAPPRAPTAARRTAAASAASTATLAAELAAVHRAAKATEHLPHWAYAGPGAPERWAGLQPDFATCASGTRQSPIDIRDGIGVQLEPVRFDYQAGGFRVLDNGHTIQVSVAPGNTIEVLGRRYELVQFHFHRPSEERVNGRAFDMVVHLLHKDVEGRLAMVAVLLTRGAAQPVVQSVWNNLPLEKGDEVTARAPLDLNALLPTDRRYYTYMGSLTEPPCSEGVLWMVMKTPVEVSPEQIAIFSRLYPMNARPIQSASGRMIKESN
jgi:carbonic anhydrase